MPLPGACASIACDHCPKPGKCCRYFVLWVRDVNGDKRALGQASPDCRPDHGLEVLAMLAEYEMPFDILFREASGSFTFWCPNLGRDGRCTDYENRPSPCRSFQPAMEPLCAIHVPAQEAP